MGSTGTATGQAGAPEVEDSATAAVYWPCNVARHRHILQATAAACMQAGAARAPANRRWTTDQLAMLLGKRRSGSGEAALASEHAISIAYLQVLLRHADSMRLRSARRRSRWDGSSDPWEWLSTPVYLQVMGEGLATVGSVRAALIAGSLRDRGSQKSMPRRAISAELWRWLAWVGPDSEEFNQRRSGGGA